MPTVPFFFHPPLTLLYSAPHPSHLRFIRKCNSINNNKNYQTNNNNNNNNNKERTFFQYPRQKRTNKMQNAKIHQKK